MTKPIKHVEKVVAVAANVAWFVYDKLNSINPNPSFTPKWSDKPLLKSWEKQKPKLGWPRETDSLCPKCIPEIRKQILDGEAAGRDPEEREGRRDQGQHHRARRQDRDGEGVPDPRPVRRPDVDRSGVLASTWKTSSRAATFAPTTTKSCTTTGPSPSRTAAAAC